EMSRFLQQYMNEALGPILILLGLVLLGWLGSGLSWQFDTQKVQERAQHGGIYWAFVVGFLFALSFCPVSAALFFGALLPLAIKSGSAVVLPFCYGAGTALPVIVFAFLLAFASCYVSRLFNRLTIAESWIRNVTGVVFILVGVYYTLIHIYGI
ncbi:MAG: sulfite exporter TauE/SafE family protein, partial [Lentisphaerae bacterium]